MISPGRKSRYSDEEYLAYQKLLDVRLQDADSLRKAVFCIWGTRGDVMAPTEAASAPSQGAIFEDSRETVAIRKKGPHRALIPNPAMSDPLLTVEDVGKRLNVSKDWVWDHCSRKKPKLPFIRMGDGALRFRASAIEAFIDERERLSGMQLGGRRRA